MHRLTAVLAAASLVLALSACSSGPSTAESCERLGVAADKWTMAAGQGTTASSIEAVRAAFQSAEPYVDEIEGIEFTDLALADSLAELVAGMRDFHQAVATTTDEATLLRKNGALAGPLTDLMDVCGL